MVALRLRAIVVGAGIACLALAGCTRPEPSQDITSLLRTQGFRFLDDPKVTIKPLCSIQVGPTRYDFFWYEWRQQNPIGARHAAFRLIQISDGKTYDGHYAGLPSKRPQCLPDRRQIIFGSDTGLGQSVVGVADGGLPDNLFADGAYHARDR